MTRSWWLRAALWGGLTAAAIFVVREKSMRSTAEVVGGTRLTYEVDLDRAVERWIVSRGAGFAEVLRGSVPSATVEPQAQSLVVKVGPAWSDRSRVLALAKEWGFGEITDRPDGFSLSLGAKDLDEVVDRSIKSAMESVQAREDGTHASVVSREGHRLVVDLTGFAPSEAQRIKGMIEQVTR